MRPKGSTRLAATMSTMKRVSVSWQPEHGRFIAEGGHRGQTIVINAPADTPEANGFSASELLLAGAASCSAWDVIDILRKQRQPVERLQVEIRGEQDSKPPWPYLRIELVYRAGGKGLSRAAVERAADLSVEKYCAVLATVRGVARVSHRVEIDEAEGGTRHVAAATDA